MRKIRIYYRYKEPHTTSLILGTNKAALLKFLLKWEYQRSPEGKKRHSLNTRRINAHCYKKPQKTITHISQM